jgi:hypothetical protein
MRLRVRLPGGLVNELLYAGDVLGVGIAAGEEHTMRPVCRQMPGQVPELAWIVRVNKKNVDGDSLRSTHPRSRPWALWSILRLSVGERAKQR